MPNNTTNRVEITGTIKDIKTIHDLVFTKDEENENEVMFNFNKILPLPEDLNIICSSEGKEAYACLYGTDEDVKYYLNMSWVKSEGITTREELTKFLENRAGQPEEGKMSWRELGERYKSNMDKYGFTTWYSWNIQNWGTKWNSYNTQIDTYNLDDGTLIFAFQTAWSPPIPVYEKLQEKFPDVNIKAYWADEGEYDFGDAVFYT